MTEKTTPATIIPPFLIDAPTADDQLGFKNWCGALTDLILGVTKQQNAICYAVFGRWGTGKTSFLRQVAREIEERAKQTNRSALWMEYSPWLYSREEHQLVPFFHLLNDAVARFLADHPDPKSYPRLRRFFRLACHVPIALVRATKGGVEAGDSKAGLSASAEIDGGAFIDEMLDFKKVLGEEDDQKFHKDVAAHYPSLYYRLGTVLRDAAKDLNVPIVVFVDDLDRCLPDKVIQVFESVKLFLDLPGFVFVLAADREIIEGGIRMYYKGINLDAKDRDDLGRNYLEKIVQFGMTLSPPNTEVVDRYIRGLLEKSAPEVAPYAPQIRLALGSNPRLLKRFAINAAFSLALARRAQTVERAFGTTKVLIMVLIGFRLPDVYREVCRSPRTLAYLQILFFELREKMMLYHQHTLSEITSSLTDADEDTKTKILVFHDLLKKMVPSLTMADFDALDAIFRLREPGNAKADDWRFKDADDIAQYLGLFAGASDEREPIHAESPKIPNLLDELLKGSK